MTSQPETNGKSPRPETPAQSISACPGCDLLLKVPAIPDGHYLACGRCGTALARACPNSLNRVLALSSAGLILYFPAMLLPLLTMSSIGMKESGTVIETCINFSLNGYYLVAVMVFLTAVIFPFLKLVLPFAVSLCLVRGRRPAWLGSALKHLKHLDEWGMVEVYLLGILVTLIKMGDVASISYEAGFFCFIGLVLLSMATTVSLDERLFWYRIDHRIEPRLASRLAAVRALLREHPERPVTAAETGIMRCHDCGQLMVMEEEEGEPESTCPRCRSTVHRRRAGSVAVTWALVLTSLVLFIPANALPIMRVDFLGIPERSTILDGILYFFEEHSYGIGLIILTASVLVPLFKIIGLLIILQTIRSGTGRFLRQKAAMFRFIEFIGRWSMLDIFVIALLSVMVNFGFFTSIHTAPAATYFCVVVVCTMVAAIVFDPRIMWDRCARHHPFRLNSRDTHGHHTRS